MMRQKAMESVYPVKSLPEITHFRDILEKGRTDPLDYSGCSRHPPLRAHISRFALAASMYSLFRFLAIPR